ncbi:MAG TPA: YceI family protein [Steroidobacteraceae bacterium]|nr:YceI family protein [Steroidobacteraceae bacterium]
MPIRNTRERWGSLSQLFHWLIVALILVQAALGLIGLLLPLGVEKLAVLARHKSIGMTILGLAVLRLLWRWLNPTPPLPPNLKPYERWLAHFTHVSLYVLLFAMPLTGWIMSSARGFPVSWFDLFQLPDLVPKSSALYDAMVITHATLASALAVVVALHIAGAIKHHFVLKDDTLRRMLPFGRITLCALAGMMLSAPATRAAAAPRAPAYTLLASQSSLTYTFIQAGARNQGRFGSFAASFDPAAGRLSVVIDMRSFDTGDQQRNGMLGGKDFFDVAQYPQSRFTASRIERTATGYEAIGSLTLRGVTRPVTVPFAWRTAIVQGRSVGYLSGQLVLRRLDFGVGQGQWHSTAWLGNDVTVHYSLVLTPPGGK